MSELLMFSIVSTYVEKEQRFEEHVITPEFSIRIYSMLDIENRQPPKTAVSTWANIIINSKKKIHIDKSYQLYYGSLFE